MSNRLLGHSIGGVPAAWGLDTIALAGGKIFYVDSENGADGNSGRDPDAALLTLAGAYAVTTTLHNDIIVLIGRATSYAITAVLDWTKDYTHLVGATPPMSCGQRARVTAGASDDLAYLVKVTGDGNSFRNIQFNNGDDSAQASGAVIVGHATKGSRNYFENCFFAGMMAANPANDASSYSLQLNGGRENVFVNCCIGADTIKRTAANAQLYMTIAGTMCPTRTLFKDCIFSSYCETAAATIVDVTACDRWVIFDNCVFYNYFAGVNLDNMLSDTEVTHGHQLIFHGSTSITGCDGVADTIGISNSFFATANPAAGAFISVSPTG